MTIPGQPSPGHTGSYTAATVTRAAPSVRKGLSTVDTVCSVKSPTGWEATDMPCSTAYTDYGMMPNYTVTVTGPASAMK